MVFEQKFQPVSLEFDLLDILACPRCHGTLQLAEGELACAGCAERYPIRNGVPVFVDYARTPEFAPRYESTDSAIGKRFGERIHQMLWKFNRNPLVVTAKSRDTLNRRLPQLLPSDAIILNLGSGQLGRDLAPFHQHRTRVVNLDIVPFKNAHVAADAHQLPFFDSTVNLVYMGCILEHVRDASTVVKECHRILKSGGYVYSTTPFMSRFHSDSDYRRWTPMGLDYLFRDFEKITSGVHCGPSSAMALALREYLPLFFGSGYLSYAVKFLIGWLLLPIAYLDVLLMRNRYAFKFAQSLYFLGRKKTQP